MKIITFILIYFITIFSGNSQQSIDKATSSQIKSNVAINKSLDSLRVVFLNLINTARSNPEQYGIDNNLQNERLDTIKTNKPYILNTSLNLKAQTYASKLSFIKYNGFGYLDHSNMEYSESLVMCTSLYKGLYDLILDLNVSNKGHRRHILEYTDNIIGIGICYIVSLDFYVIVIETDF